MTAAHRRLGVEHLILAECRHQEPYHVQDSALISFAPTERRKRLLSVVTGRSEQSIFWTMPRSDLFLLQTAVGVFFRSRADTSPSLQVTLSTAISRINSRRLCGR